MHPLIGLCQGGSTCSRHHTQVVEPGTIGAVLHQEVIVVDLGGGGPGKVYLRTVQDGIEPGEFNGEGGGAIKCKIINTKCSSTT